MPVLGRAVARARVLGRLAALERDQGLGGVHPSAWRRGYASSRRTTYPRANGAAYLSDVALVRGAATLNGASARALVEQRTALADALVARGLGEVAPRVLGTVVGRELRARSPEALERLRAQERVLVEPAIGPGGLVRVVDAGRAGHLVAAPRADLLVRELVPPDPALTAVDPSPLTTARLLCVRLPEGPEVVSAVLAWGSTTAGGALRGPVDLATGALGPAPDPSGRGAEGSGAELDHHPVTGAPAAGMVVPHWPEVLDLAAALMRALPEVDHVTWHLAISAAGPVVAGGSTDRPELEVFQRQGSLLADERLRRFYAARGLAGSSPWVA